MPGLLVDLSIIKQEKAYKRAHHQVHKTPPRPTKVYRRYKDPHFEKAPDYSPESKSCGSFLSAMPTRPHRLPALTPQAGQPDVDRWIRTSDSYGNRYQMHASPSQSSDSRLSANYGMPMAPVAMMQLPQMPQYPGLPGRDALGAVDLARERRGPPAQPPPAMQAPRGGGRPRGVEQPPQAADLAVLRRSGTSKPRRTRLSRRPTSPCRPPPRLGCATTRARPTGGGSKHRLDLVRGRRRRHGRGSSTCSRGSIRWGMGGARAPRRCQRRPWMRPRPRCASASAPPRSRR